jgi:D-glycero-D-manno-heptose 1,7-bisphosphate phosphatase
MVQIQGKPFLEHQIGQLREQGFDRVLLLLGYLPEVVRDYFGNGGHWGIKIEYSITDVNDETARRLKFAEPFLDRCFLLMYCDNYWPMQIDKMWQRFCSSNIPAMITVYRNKDGYTRDSVRVDPDGYVTIYDKTGTSPGLQGVEISYALVDKSVLSMMPDMNISVEEALYRRLAQKRQLLGYVTDHRYYSVGALHRLPLTETFFAHRPTIILDRDGVLNKKPPRAEYVRSWNEFQWLPGAKQALRLLKAAGYRVVVVSNQAGIGRGIMREADLTDIHDRMKAEAQRAGGQIDAIYHCPHDWDKDCACRKPSPGLLFQAQREFHLDLSRTPFIGDDDRDSEAAEAAGCPFVQVTEQNSFFDCVRELVERS